MSRDSGKIGAVLRELHRLLPESRSIASDFDLTVDSIDAALQAAHRSIVMTRIPDFETQDWNDTALSRLIFKHHASFHRGNIFIHSPACSRHNLDDFHCADETLLTFIDDFEMEMFFDGDVLILAPQSATLTLFHHEGAFSHVRL